MNVERFQTMKGPVAAVIVTMLCLVASFTYAAPQSAPATAPTTRPKTFALHMVAAGKGPAMQYRLLPIPSDLTEGNAAILYMTATANNLMTAKAPGGVAEKAPVDEWLAMAPADIPSARVMEVIGAFRGALREVEMGARRERCDWDMPDRIEGAGTLLPYLGDLRFLCGLLTVQARLQIAEGKFDEAAHTLQTVFGVAQHLDQGYLINVLVAASVASRALNAVDDWVRAPGAPNLYWTLSELPAPFFDFHAATRKEEGAVTYSIPFYREAATGHLTAEHFAQLSAELSSMMRRWRDEGEAAAPIAALEGALKTPPNAARPFLQSLGFEARALDAMEPSQLIGLYYIRNFEWWMQEMGRWTALPYPVAAPELARIEAALKASTDRIQNPVLTFMSTPSRAFQTLTRFDRRVAALRCIEAVRAYASAHDGKLPTSLAQAASSGTPIPLDPMTGGPFEYRIDGAAAVLEGAAPAGGTAEDVIHDRISVVK